MSDNRQRHTVYLTIEEREIIDQQAKAAGMARGSYLRELALSGKDFNVKVDPSTFSKAVEAAARCIPGTNRVQLEHAVAKVITTVAA